MTSKLATKVALSILILAFAVLIPLRSVLADGGGYVWTDQTPSGGLHNGSYGKFGVSANGQNMVTENGTDILVSTNYGVSWNNVTTGTALSGLSWGTIAMSSNGLDIVAAAETHDVYMSTDDGTTWTNISAGKALHGATYGGLTISSNGQVISTTSGGHIYTSTNAGTSWIVGNVTNSFFANIVASANGQVIYVVPDGGGADGDIYKSSDTGATWTDVTPSGAVHDHTWYGIATSANGQIMTAAAFGNDIFTSTDGGSTWTDDTPSGAVHNKAWEGTVTSANGQVIVASINSGDVYTSTDGGSTWTDTTPSGVGHSLPWQTMGMSMTGQYIVGTTNGGGGGDIYTAVNTSLAPSTSGTLSNAIDSKSIGLTLPANTTYLTSDSTTSLTSLGKTDSNYTYPLGLVNLSYETLNASDQITLVFVTNLSSSQVVARDYNSSTQTFNTVSGAVISSTTYNGQPALSLTYSVADNGSLDSDAVLNEVTDPVGLAELPASPNTGFGQYNHTNFGIEAIFFVSIVSIGWGVRTLQERSIKN